MHSTPGNLAWRAQLKLDVIISVVIGIRLIRQGEDQSLGVEVEVKLVARRGS